MPQLPIHTVRRHTRTTLRTVCAELNLGDFCARHVCTQLVLRTLIHTTCVTSCVGANRAIAFRPFTKNKANLPHLWLQNSCCPVLKRKKKNPLEQAMQGEIRSPSAGFPLISLRIGSP